LAVGPLLAAKVLVSSTPVEVLVGYSGDGDVEVRLRLKHLGRRVHNLCQILSLADRVLFRLALSASREPLPPCLNMPMEDASGGVGMSRWEWDKPLHVEHFRAIGMVRRALEAGCRTIAEICDYTGLHHTDVVSALRYLAREKDGR